MRAADERPLLADVEAIAYPRFAGTCAEVKARRWVYDQLKATGLTVHEEFFRTARHAVRRLRLTIHTMVSVGALALATMYDTGHFGAAAVLGLGLVGAFPFFAKWRLQVEGAFDVGEMVETANVIAERPAAGGAAGPGDGVLGPGDGVCGPAVDAPAQPSRRGVIFIAHVDSKSVALPTFVPVAVLVAFLLGVLAYGLLAAYAAIAGGAPALPAALAPATVLPVLALATFALPFLPFGDESPGALDNASGVAVLLDLARRLPADPALADTDLAFVASGAEELGLAGAMRWAQKHGDDWDPAQTLVVNVDSVGAGKGLIAVDVRGEVAGRSTARFLADVTREAKLPLRHLPFLPGVGVDSMPLAARGFATISLLGEVLGGASRRIHTRRDTTEWLNEEGLRNASRAAAAIARAHAASRSS